jgi:hypothetical protein
LSSVGAGPRIGDEASQTTDPVNRPLYISLDLGLRQRRKHYHGQLLFQCIALPDNYFDSPPGDNSGETNESILAPSGGCLKIAEGGRYDDLVSKGCVCVSPVDSFSQTTWLAFCVGPKISPSRKFWVSAI